MKRYAGLFALLCTAALPFLPACEGSLSAADEDSDHSDADDVDIDSVSDAISKPGNWRPTEEVRRKADQQRVAYDDVGSKCTGSLTSGAKALGDYVKLNFKGVTDYGGYSCRRNTANRKKLSVHAVGRALDISIKRLNGAADNTKGDAVANYLISHAEEIGIQLVIWDNSVWIAQRAAGKKLTAYTGPDPHTNHIHAELSEEGAARQTNFFTKGMPSPAGSETAPVPNTDTQDPSGEGEADPAPEPTSAPTTTPPPTSTPAPTSTPTTTPTTTPVPTSTPTTTPTTPPTTSVTKCANDGTCNPGNNGSGKICQSGVCVPGCRADFHCPGIKTCQSGMCK
jgi:hypothetical protein